MALATCSHLNVIFREAGWICAACDEAFIPRKRAVETQERNYQLLQAAMILGAGYLASTAGGIGDNNWTDRWPKLIRAAENVLNQIEIRNAPHVPIRDSGF